ncbi:MAG: protein MraZ [Candidatus Cloacimonadia bacterium]|jgi:division/cell wall cluster transcriptional repressor MraZ
MSGEFLGTYENSVNKNRVIIPAPFKKVFSVAARETVVVTMGYCQSNIAVYPKDVWNAKVEKLSNGTPKDRNLYIYLRDNSTEETLEGPGRIKIAPYLLELVGITDSVVVKGEGSYITLWNPETLNEQRLKDLEVLRTNYTRLDYEL